MYQAIVFLPLVGAILAGLISLAGARARFPGGSPPAEGTAHAHDEHAHTTHAHAPHDQAHAGDDAHHPTEPAAAGSRAAEAMST